MTWDELIGFLTGVADSVVWFFQTVWANVTLLFTSWWGVLYDTLVTWRAKIYHLVNVAYDMLDTYTNAWWGRALLVLQTGWSRVQWLIEEGYAAIQTLLDMDWSGIVGGTLNNIAQIVYLTETAYAQIVWLAETGYGALVWLATTGYEALVWLGTTGYGNLVWFVTSGYGLLFWLVDSAFATLDWLIGFARYRLMGLTELWWGRLTDIATDQYEAFVYLAVNAIDTLTWFTEESWGYVAWLQNNFDRLVQMLNTDWAALLLPLIEDRYQALLLLLQNPGAWIFSVLETYLYPWLEDWLASLFGLAQGDLPPRRTLF